MNSDHQNIPLIRKIPWLCWPVLVLVCILWLPYLQVLSPNISFGDEGLVAQSAYRIYLGQAPFRDYFTALTPGSYYWFAILFKLFGPSFLVLRLGVLLVSLLLLLGTWLVLARFQVSTVAAYLVPAGFLAYFGGPCWFIASHHWLSAVLCIAAFALLLPQTGKEAPSLPAATLAGLLSALAAFTLQHRGGLWIMIGSLVFLLLPRTRRLAPCAAYWLGISAFAVPAAIYFVSVAGWDTLYYDLIVFPFKQYHKFEGHRGIVFQHLLELWNTVSSAWLFRSEPLGILRIVSWHLGYVGLIIVLMLPFAGLYLLWRLWKIQAYSTYQLGCLAAFFLSTYLATLHRLSDTTLIFAAPATVIIIALTFDSIKIGNQGLPVVARTLLIAWITLFFSIGAGYSALTFLSPKVSIRTPAGTVQALYASDAEKILGVKSFASAAWKKGETVFCYPYAPIFYFLFRLTNPTQYDTLTWPMHTDVQLEHARNMLHNSACRWIIVNSGQPLFNRTIPFELYLSERYTVRRTFENVSILERHP
jgi:hypothetical protein